jgi:hypothetical protein
VALRVNDSEFSELLQYLRGRLRNAGLASLDERLLSREAMQAEAPAERLLGYLDMLEGEFQLQSDRTQAELIERLRRVVATDTGHPVQGVEVWFSDADRQIYGVDRLDLWATPEMSAIVEELRGLRSELSESRDLGLDGP